MNQINFSDVNNMLDRFFLQSLENVSQKFPPYSVGRNKTNPNEYILQLALAGFTEDDLNVVMERNILTVSSTGETRPSFEDDSYQYTVVGIAKRKFSRRFTLFNSGPIEVTKAVLRDGILSIYLRNIIPEEHLPKKINISSGDLSKTVKTESKPLWMDGSIEPKEHGWYAAIYYNGITRVARCVQYKGYWDIDTNFDLLFFAGPFRSAYDAQVYAEKGLKEQK